jgi:hypothetical protein
MKKILIFVLFLVLYGCEDVNVDKKETGYIIKYGATPLKIVVVDSCEYLFGDWGRASIFTHKGNCKNPEHGK